MSANTVLAYLFGFTFSGVLAYAGLRDKPITDPGQFFLLRLIAALSAAGIAAVLPGFFDFKWTASKNVVVRGGGALGVFALVFLANPPQLIQSHVKEREISMLGDYDSGRYLDAERLADEILKEDSKNARAWNVKGGVSYYRQDYQQAKDCFEKALSLSPNNPYYSSNLGYAQVEVGAYLQAIDSFKLISDRKTDWHYAMGRAQLYASEYLEARKHLQSVPTEYWHGAARILEAASIAGLAKLESTAVGSNWQVTIREEIDAALAQDRTFWKSIVSGTFRDMSQTYTLPIKLIKDVGINVI